MRGVGLLHSIDVSTSVVVIMIIGVVVIVRGHDLVHVTLENGGRAVRRSSVNHGGIGVGYLSRVGGNMVVMLESVVRAGLVVWRVRACACVCAWRVC